MPLFRSLAFCLLATAPFLSAAGKIFPYPYTQEDLPNGLRLITIPTDYPNIVSLFIVVGTGSRNEVEPGKTGFAHLFEHLMFRGTAEYPPEKYTAILKTAGAASNAYTSNDLTAYHTTFSKEDLPTILSMEADRFQHLDYPEAAFKTETLAVLGEFNKNSASPGQQLRETLSATAFKTHPYSHTTMGFLKDVQNMPQGYAYSREFFSCYYRPEYTTIIVAGDVDAKKVRSLVDERWGQWKRGAFKPSIPAEPPQNGPRRAHVDWKSDTIPQVTVAWRGPAYSDDTMDTVALDAIAHLGYDQNSPLYQKLVVEEQKVQSMGAEAPTYLDPELFQVNLHVKDAKDLGAVEAQVKATAQSFSDQPVDAKKLDLLKQHLRYEFAMGLDNSEAIAGTVASYVALRRTPETMNRYYDMLSKLTPADIQRIAKKYLIEKNLDVVTLTYAGGCKVIRPLIAFALLAGAANAQIRTVELPGKSPLVTIRLVFTTGAVSDPADKPGAAALTAAMLSDGGTKTLTYKQITDTFYPMAAGIESYSDKEMTTFVGETHVDNLEKFYALMKDAVLNPGWRPEDFTRLRDQQINALRVGLRGNNDEELGKEVLYNVIYKGHPYGREDLGTMSALQKMTVADLEAFHHRHYTQANLIIGLAGGYPAGFADRVKKDFAALPAGPADKFDLPEPAALHHNAATIIEKDTRSVVWSLGFPINLRRGDPDFPALLVAQSWLGQHRESGGRLFNRMRELRGLNYGDYAYIEYFPRGMFGFEPEPNIARHQQIFQIWIRPVEVPNAVFALRLAMYELDQLVKNGIPAPDFEKTRSFLSKYVNILTKTKSAELGYAIDSKYYGMPEYNEYLKSALASLKAEDVNRVIKKYLHADNVQIVGVAKDAAGLKAALVSAAATPITYNSPKPKDITDEDKKVEVVPLGLKPEDVTIVPVNTVFEN